MNQKQKDQLVRALDMTETELRAALLFIINEVYSEAYSIALSDIVAKAIDAAYNPIRRTGVRL